MLAQPDARARHAHQPTVALERVVDGLIVCGMFFAATATLPAGTRFVVIGRCCDVGSQSHNQALGRDRAAQGRGLLLGLPLQSGSISDSQIYSRGEQIAPASAVGTAPAPADFPSPTAQAQLTPRTASEWRIKNPDIYGNKLASFHGNDQPERKEYRGVDIFAVFPDAAAQPSTTHDADTLAALRHRLARPVPHGLRVRRPGAHHR